MRAQTYSEPRPVLIARGDFRIPIVPLLPSSRFLLTVLTNAFRCTTCTCLPYFLLFLFVGYHVASAGTISHETWCPHASAGTNLFGTTSRVPAKRDCTRHLSNSESIVSSLIPISGKQGVVLLFRLPQDVAVHGVVLLLTAHCPYERFLLYYRRAHLPNRTCFPYFFFFLLFFICRLGYHFLRAFQVKKFTCHRFGGSPSMRSIRLSRTFFEARRLRLVYPKPSWHRILAVLPSESLLRLI